MAVRDESTHGNRRWWYRRAEVWIVLAYAVSLLLSHRAMPEPRPLPPLREDQRAITVPAIGEGSDPRDLVRFAYFEWGATDPSKPVVVMLHGSPGSGGVFAGNRLGPRFADGYRVIAPDLPGFGRSTRQIPDYSIAAHAGYVRALFDSIGVAAAHVLGFSLGGGVALELAHAAPERVQSVVMVNAVGVQELEFLGDYYLNHAIHGLQLAAMRGVYFGVPHFGRFQPGFEYARNFYDSDQRPLRGILERFEPPMLIVHGEQDPLVPAAAAREHHRIVPQSEMVMFDPGDHFMVFRQPAQLTEPIRDFVDRVERGTARTRGTADPKRVARAAIARRDVPMAGTDGFPLQVVLWLLVLATLVSGDIACIAAGLLVARGSLDFVPVVVSCYLGIVVGNTLLYLWGRRRGPDVERSRALRWLVGWGAWEHARSALEGQGPRRVFTSIFRPGQRLITYVAAGALRLRAIPTVAWFLVGAAIWAPLVVGAPAVVGWLLGGAVDWWADAAGLWIALGSIGVVVVLRRLTRFRGAPRWESAPPPEGV